MEGRDSVHKGEDKEGFGEDKVEAEEKKRREGWIMGGGWFNARMGEREAIEEGEEGKERISKDKLKNK